MMLIKKTVGYATPLFFIMATGAFGLYNYIYFSTIPTYQKRLTEMVHQRTQDIHDYLNEQEKNAIQLASNFTPTQTSLTTHKENMGFKNIFFIDKDGIITFST